MNNKLCIKCNILREISNFHKSKARLDGYNIYCKKCVKESTDLYYIKNKEKILKNSKIYHDNNDRTLYKKLWYQRNKEKCLLKERIYRRERYKIDIIFQLKYTIGNNLRRVLNRKKFYKNNKIENILGCNIQELKNYLENKFEPWMSWSNYGKYNQEYYYGWDIDHIIPTSSAQTEEEIYKLNHFSNLQPLCSKINREIKKDKI